MLVAVCGDKLLLGRSDWLWNPRGWVCLPPTAFLSAIPPGWAFSGSSISRGMRIVRTISCVPAREKDNTTGRCVGMAVSSNLVNVGFSAEMQAPTRNKYKRMGSPTDG